MLASGGPAENGRCAGRGTNEEETVERTNAQASRPTRREAIGGERGEGVISAAIAILIVALLGAAMWVVFSGMMDGASDRIQDSVESIG